MERNARVIVIVRPGVALRCVKAHTARAYPRADLRHAHAFDSHIANLLALYCTEQNSRV